ncbi:MAG: hypothetical protein MZW92_76110 [Comamonadaceae bacterium]|nr:hypothetical protein [Comamonadaceae bacterium]
MSAVLHQHDLSAGFWRLADPKITLASMASILLGAAAAVHVGADAWGWLALVILGIFALEWAKNASGEIYDFASGADQARGRRRSQSVLRRQAGAGRRPAHGARDLGHRAGRLRDLHRRRPGDRAAARARGAVVRASAGVALAFFYHAPPLKLSYRGWGEAAVFLAYGPLICAGTFLGAWRASWRRGWSGWRCRWAC